MQSGTVSEIDVVVSNFRAVLDEADVMPGLLPGSAAMGIA
jgi:hypothetical protein